MKTAIRSPSRKAAPLSLAERVRSPRAAYWVFCSFVVIVFFTGGGSRGDIQSLLLLRPLSIVFACYALILSPVVWGRAGLPFGLLLALGVVMIVQLVPMPFAVWSNLPGRATIAESDRIVGLGHVWRALTVSPNLTMNSLFALGVPIAAFLLAGSQSSLDPRRLLWPILAGAGISALFGLLQILGPNGGRFYLYAITNPDDAVGLFSNRNHQAIFLASAIPLIAYVALRTNPKDPRRPLVLAACIAAIAFAVPSIVTTGSRNGIVLTLVAMAMTAVLWAARVMMSSRSKSAILRERKMLMMAVLGSFVVGGAALAYVILRSAAFGRLFSEQLDGELRVQLLPHLLGLISKYFPVGSGFGTFELVYKAIEPLALLQPRYLNEAHNDLLQFAIEGGLAAVSLLAVFLGWFLIRGWQHARAYFSRSGSGTAELEVGIFAWASLATLLAGSLGDYPLRVPSVMLYAALLCVLIGRPATRRAGGARRPD